MAEGRDTVRLRNGVKRLFRNSRFIAVLVIAAVALSLGAYYYLRSPGGGGGGVKPPVSREDVDNIMKPYYYWSYITPGDPADNYIADRIIPIIHSKMPEFRDLMDKLNHTGIRDPVAGIYGRIIKWFERLEANSSHSYAAILAGSYLYAYYMAGKAALLRGNRTALDKFLREASINASRIANYTSMLRRDMGLIYGNISVFKNMGLLAVPEIYEDAYSCVENAGGITPPPPNAKQVSSGQLANFYYPRLISLGCAYYYIIYVYPVLHNYTFTQVLTRENIEKYSSNLTIQDYISETIELYREASAKALKILQAVNAVAAGHSDQFLDKLRAYLEAIARNRTVKEYHVLHTYYNALLYYTGASAISSSIDPLVEYYANGTTPSLEDIEEAYKEALSIANKTIQSGLGNYTDPLMVSDLFLYPSTFTIVDYYRSYVSGLGSPYSDQKAIVYAYTTYEIVKEYFKLLPKILAEYLI